jgi:polar amino acid transport system substrate-binding protein
MFAKAAWTTIIVSLFSMIMAMSLGLILAIIRIYTPFKFIAVAYIEIIRGTPLLVQLLLIFYGLPNIGIRLDPFVAGVIGLGLNYAAFEAENYRAGLLSVPRSQYEAAKALGMTQWQALRYVILPQSVRLVIPPVTNDFISLLKDSSLVSMITIVDLTQQYNLLATTYYDYFGIGIQVALIYFIIGIPFVMLSRWAERKIGRNGLRRKKYSFNLIR